MDYAAIVVLEILYMIAFLALISAGLAIVFGMMRVINLAHGEFVMVGGYATIAAAKAAAEGIAAMQRQQTTVYALQELHTAMRV